ncbi:TrkH family potassium uptake protein [Inmirania thermothiophila]|uniref:Trk system potassium uptake protein n=1 Tax=Inmirania thermothiophila TaxID=1750597 RepID=A0A3N1Y611_9GAMM|nr:TrkH family potassium uptake protein [Inmirania thermothiophila]ROR34246.1 trk system potassium uptake protein TrkH [Inmirania thermothiophila]
MHPAAIAKVVGILLTLFSGSMLPPAGIGLLYGDGAVQPFLIAFLVLLGLGLALWLPCRRTPAELRVRDGFLVVVLFWSVLGATGAVPLMLAERPHLDLVNAVFESVSGLTTTGATVLTGIEELPRAVRFYRQQLQWLGGLGIVVVALAVLPMLGVGGMQLYRAETPGPMKDTKLTPRLAETAKALWYIYLGLTAACALAYRLAGMDWFDAVGHAFSTVAIGGFSTYDASIGYFDSTAVELVAVVFMLLAGMNFALHFGAVRRRSLRVYAADPEVRAYLGILAASAAVSVLFLYASGTFDRFPDALHHGVFQAVSIGTTTGFTTHEYFTWPGFLPVMLILTSFVGGCAGSTGGGMKVIRWLLLYHQGRREILRLIHPAAMVPVKVGGRVLPESVMGAVWGFFAVYVVTFAVLMLALMATGLDQVSAFSAVAATLNNLGPGLGEVGAHFGTVGDAGKWILILAMLLGRLEIFTFLVVITPAFWRR